MGQGALSKPAVQWRLSLSSSSQARQSGKQGRTAHSKAAMEVLPSRPCVARHGSRESNQRRNSRLCLAQREK